ncbi:MAG: hypothetical protein V8S75_02990 [[Ruminococcus] torques]
MPERQRLEVGTARCRTKYGYQKAQYRVSSDRAVRFTIRGSSTTYQHMDRPECRIVPELAFAG